MKLWKLLLGIGAGYLLYNYFKNNPAAPAAAAVAPGSAGASLNKSIYNDPEAQKILNDVVNYWKTQASYATDGLLKLISKAYDNWVTQNKTDRTIIYQYPKEDVLNYIKDTYASLKL